MSFDYLQRQVTIAHQLDDPTVLLERIRALGLEAEFFEEVVAETPHQGLALSAKVLLGLSGIFAVSAELGDWFLPRQHSSIILILAILSIAACAKEVFPPAWRAVRSFSL